MAALTSCCKAVLAAGPEFAEQLAKSCSRSSRRPNGGGFFLTARDHEPLITAHEALAYDNARPRQCARRVPDARAGGAANSFCFALRESFLARLAGRATCRCHAGVEIGGWSRPNETPHCVLLAGQRRLALLRGSRRRLALLMLAVGVERGVVAALGRLHLGA